MPAWHPTGTALPSVSGAHVRHEERAFFHCRTGVHKLRTLRLAHENGAGRVLLPASAEALGHQHLPVRLKHRQRRLRVPTPALPSQSTTTGSHSGLRLGPLVGRGSIEERNLANLMMGLEMLLPLQRRARGQAPRMQARCFHGAYSGRHKFPLDGAHQPAGRGQLLLGGVATPGAQTSAQRNTLEHVQWGHRARIESAHPCACSCLERLGHQPRRGYDALIPTRALKVPAQEL